MNDYLSALHSRRARLRSIAAVEAGAVHSLHAEPALRVLVNDQSPILISRGGRVGVGEVRFSALAALQRILLHHEKPIDLGEVEVRKWMLEDDVWQRFASAPRSEIERVASQVTSVIAERVLPDEDEKPLLSAYVALQCLGLVDYRKETVDPVTYTTPLQEEVRISQLVSPRPRPHLRVANARTGERVFGYVFRNERGRYVIDFAEGAGSYAAVEILTAVLQSPLDAVVLVGAETARNPDGTARWGERLDLQTADPIRVLHSLRAYVERRYHTTIMT